MMLDQLTEEIKQAMRAKDQTRLRALRLIKSALMLLHADGKSHDDADELAVLVKLAKQRKDALTLYNEQGREDLAIKEQEELEVIETFLPKPMSEEDIRSKLKAIIAETGAEGMKDMGKVMGLATQRMKGRADGQQINALLRPLLI